MTLSSAEIARLCELARLAVEDDEIADVSDKLSDIVRLVDQLQAIDTEGISPMAHPMDATQRLRDDEVTERDERDRFQDNAPSVQDGLYLVPKVIE
jgi:aspartyl-tRNA(Asn)/glutamyl-tRNA(Gln) amidotransferase subunit C